MPRVKASDENYDFALFGRNVREQRIMRRWSIEKLAARAGIAPHTVLRVEHGFPSTDSKRECICYALGVSIKRLEAERKLVREDVAVHRTADDRWLTLLDYRPHTPEESDELIQDERERLRLARLGFVPQFVKMMNCRLPKGRLVAGIIEVHSGLLPSRYLGGEVFAFALRGNTVLHYGDEEFPLDQGQAATIDCTTPFYFAPSPTANPATPSLVLYVRLDDLTANEPNDEEYAGWFVGEQQLPINALPPVKKPRKTPKPRRNRADPA